MRSENLMGKDVLKVGGNNSILGFGKWMLVVESCDGMRLLLVAEEEAKEEEGTKARGWGRKSPTEPAIKSHNRSVKSFQAQKHILEKTHYLKLRNSISTTSCNDYIICKELEK